MASELPNVKLESNGSYWRARWTDAKGKPRSQSLGPKAKISKRKAQQEARRLALRILGGELDLANGPTLEQWKDEYKKLREKDISRDTMTLHMSTLGYLIQRLGGKVAIGMIDHNEAQHWRRWMQDQKLAEATVRRHVRTAKTIWSYAKLMGHVAENPFVGLPSTTPVVDKDWHYVDRDDLDELLAACPDDRWRCAFALCRLAGLRLAEALHLTWSRIDWNKRTLEIVTRARKETTKQRRRVVPIEPQLYDLLLQAMHAAPEGCQRPCEGLDMHDGAFYMRVKEWIIMAGLNRMDVRIGRSL